MKISIITATFNSGTPLRDTMESVLRQSFQDFEHIIIDGGSNDNTLGIIAEFEPRYNGRLKYISEKDRGLYDAMNKGINTATGDVIGILNSDDFYTSSDVLSTVAKEIEDVDAVYGDIHFVAPSNLSKCTRYYSSKLFRPWMMRLGFIPAHPSFYCRRELFSRYGLFDLDFKVAADFELLLRFIYVNKISIRYIEKDFVTMRTGGASTSGWKSYKAGLHDHMLAYRKNNLTGSYFLEGLRYIYKLAEVAKYRITHL